MPTTGNPEQQRLQQSGPGLTSGQSTFAVRLSQDTGLSAQLISAWELAEESGSAAQSYQSQNFNDWLNIGIPADSGGMHSYAAWKDPISAADQTAAWMEGKAVGGQPASIPGWGGASSGIRKILQANKSDPNAVIGAIGASGWGTDAANISKLYPQMSGSAGVANDIGGAASSAAGAVAGAVSGAVSAVDEISSIWSALTNPHNWLRALEILAAVLAVYFAMKSLTGVDPAAVVEKSAGVAAMM